MNFTVANHNNAKNPNGFVHYQTVEFSDIPQMVMSGYCYCACKLKDEYRVDNNFEGFVDVLIIDIDDSCTIEQAKIIFKQYEYFIVTSKSHQKDKNGLVCDRFRVFLLLDKTIDDRKTMEEVYIGFINKYPFVDVKCKNVSRFFYSSPSDALVFYNKGRKYKTNICHSVNPSGVESKNDTSPISKVTSSEIYRYSELKEMWITDSGLTLEVENQDKKENKIKGGITFLDNEFYSGNRNNAMFSCACMLLKDGLDEEEVVKFLVEENEKRDSVKFNEVVQCVRSALRTI